MTLSSPVVPNSRFQVTVTVQKIITTRSNPRVNTVTNTGDPERLGLCELHMPKDTECGAVVVQSCRSRAGALLAGLTVLRSCSRRARPAGSRRRSGGAREPPRSDRTHPLQCYKITNREKLKGGDGGEGTAVLLAPAPAAAELWSLPRNRDQTNSGE